MKHLRITLRQGDLSMFYSGQIPDNDDHQTYDTVTLALTPIHSTLSIERIIRMFMHIEDLVNKDSHMQFHIGIEEEETIGQHTSSD